MLMTNHKTKNKTGRMVCIAGMLLTVLVLISGCGQQVAEPDDVYGQIRQTAHAAAENLLQKNPSPGVSSVGGEWLVIGLLYSGIETPENYYEHYYDNVRVRVKQLKGILSDSRCTEYARVIICLSALGREPEEVEGYHLAGWLDDYEKVAAQGSSAASFALIAARMADIRLENEERYIDLILAEAPEDKRMGDEVLTDYISMAMEALSFYQEREDVKTFMQDAVLTLSAAQTESGALNNAESTAECIIALLQAGFDPLQDERFLKNGNNLYDGLMEHYLGDGNFFHDSSLKEADPMATERALLALDALLLGEENHKLYEDSYKGMEES